MFAQAEWQAAIRLFELVLKVDSDHLTARRYLGEALLEQGRVEEALKQLHKVYQSDPEAGRDSFRKALQSLAMQCWTRGEKQLAERAAKQAALLGEAPSSSSITPENPSSSITAETRQITPENAARLHEQNRLGRGRITAITYAPGGETLAIGSAIGVYLYDIVTGQSGRFLPTPAWVWCLAYTADGSHMAAGLDNGKIRLWHMDTPDTPRDISAHQTPVHTLIFSPDGTLMASGARDGTVRLWRMSDGALMRTIEYEHGLIRSLAFSPDNTHLALAFGHRHIHIRRIKDGALLHTLHGHHQAVHTLAYTSDGRFLASGAEDGHIHFWKPDEEQPAQTLKDFMGVVTQVSFSPDNRMLASASWDGSIRLWRPGSGAIWKHLEEQRYPISHCLFSPQGLTLSSLTIHEEVVRIWNISNGEIIKSLSHNGALTSLAISRQQHYLAAGTGDGRVLLWSYPITTTEPEVTLIGHQQAVHTLSFDPSGQYLVSAGHDPFLLLWKLSTSAARRIFLPNGHGVISRLLFSPNGQHLFVATEDGDIFTWPTQDLWETAWQPIVPQHWVQRSQPITDLACSADGRLLAGISVNGKIRLWDTQRQTRLHTTDDYAETLRCAAFSPDGNLLATGATSGQMQLWRIPDLSMHRILPCNEAGTIRTLDFSPDNRILAAAGQDGHIYLWDVIEGTRLGILQGHTQQIWQLAFSPDGKTLLSASDDGTLRLWEP
ncbi:MAG: hypothetical protein Fur0018_25590 [Anaerolineales bacterium]